MMPYPGGLTRNVVQCLEDFGIPLHLSAVVTEIHGRQRVEAVTIAQCDPTGAPVPGSERLIRCDTLLISAGLIPENELSQGAGVLLDPLTRGPAVDQDMETLVPGVFACGDVAYVHNMVDWVSADGETAGAAAARRILGRRAGGELSRPIPLCPGKGVQCVMPQRLTRIPDEGPVISLRPRMIARDVKVSFRDEKGKVLHSAPRKVVRPAEISDVRIPANALQGRAEVVVEIGRGSR
jgi:NADH dehydrogenase FAD-containing subunit